ncbi:flagellar basal-body rod protein FlgF [Hyphococcus sp.]|uniref:flagellar basal-body rod protein FlgF n=1 Tax=Hyphococcus sp. TaxID=2038636 RepID=UPI003D12141A
MDTSLYVSLSHRVAVNRELEIVANNLANMNTTAFKAERVLFDDVMKKAGASDPVSFVIDRASYTDYKTGPLIRTENMFDLAINGEGWFSVQTADGVRYTRDGRFVVAPSGELTALDGSPVLDEGGGAILIPQEEPEISIGNDGVITAGDLQIGRVAVYEFENEQGLTRGPNGRYEGLDAPAISTDARVVQGAIEGSNVDPVSEVTRLIDLSRSYEQASRLDTDVHSQKKDAIRRLGENR